MHDREVRPFIFKNVQSFVSNEKYFIIFVSFFFFLFLFRRIFLEHVTLSISNIFQFRQVFLDKVFGFSLDLDGIKMFQNNVERSQVL